MGISNEKLLFTSFRKCPIAPVEGAPSYMLLNTPNSHFNACATSVHRNLGDGTLGYIVLTAPPATYNLLSTILFVVPVNVGPTIIITDPATTAIVTLELVYNHAKKLWVWQEYNNVDRAIKRVLKAIAPGVYFRTLRNRHTGYATVHSLGILTHLHATYGMIKDEDTQAIDMAVKKQINGEPHFEYFIDHI